MKIYNKRRLNDLTSSAIGAEETAGGVARGAGLRAAVDRQLRGHLS